MQRCVRRIAAYVKGRFAHRLRGMRERAHLTNDLCILRSIRWSLAHAEQRGRLRVWGIVLLREFELDFQESPTAAVADTLKLVNDSEGSSQSTSMLSTFAAGGPF